MNFEARTSITLLMKGIFYKEDNELVWSELIGNSNGAIREYFDVMGLHVRIDEIEGYAYLENQTLQEEEKKLPKLIASRELSYKVSLLCVLLRKKIIDVEMQNEESRVVVSYEDITSLLLLFLPQKFNEVKLYKEMDTTIKKVQELGFLKKLKNSEKSYEIKSSIKAFVDAQWLNDFSEQLEAYKKENLWL